MGEQSHVHAERRETHGSIIAFELREALRLLAASAVLDELFDALVEEKVDQLRTSGVLDRSNFDEARKRHGFAGTVLGEVLAEFVELLQRQVTAHVPGQIILLHRPGRLRELRDCGASVLAAVGEQLKPVGTSFGGGRRSLPAGLTGANARLFDFDDRAEKTEQIEAEMETRQAPEVVDESRPRDRLTVG